MKNFGGLVALLGLLATGEGALACECGPMSRAQAIAATPYVFDGRVLRVREQGGTRLASVETMRPVKGAVPRVVEVASPVSSARCGYQFQRGQRLTIGATLREEQFWSHSCVMQSLNQKAR